MHQYPKLHVSFGYLDEALDIRTKPALGELGKPGEGRRGNRGRGGDRGRENPGLALPELGGLGSGWLGPGWVGLGPAGAG